MTHNQSHSWLSSATAAVGKGLTAVGILFAAGALTAGCLDRPVAPATPTTTNVYISEIRQTGVDKIDLLFMIDNSISMADKQEILANAVPVLVQRLISPSCVDASGKPDPAGSTAPNCQGIYTNEFKPIQDIHIGIVTSSLGDHGSHDVCSDEQNALNGGTSQYNDMAQLLPTVRTGLYSWNTSGFLVWDPRDQTSLPLSDRTNPQTMNETDAKTFINNFTAQVTGAGENGCGYEAQLESWYRFLVDPSPVAKMDNNGQTSVRPKDPADGSGKTDLVNSVVLQERSQFLRADSLLAVVMLSDENDCSIIDEDGTQGWLVGWKGGAGKQGFHMPRANSVCTTDPNNSCCRPCSSPAPAGCGDNHQDPACTSDESTWTLSANDDSMNERCYDQVQRFGINLLYSPQRYVDGLSQRFITPHFGGGQVPNPIFQTDAKGNPPREADLVFLAGIIGVPWQDISTPDSLMQGNPALNYLTAADIKSQGRWDVILGDPDNNVPPTDPFMIESIKPRTTGATDPAFPQASITASTSTQLNPVNGHEQDPLAANDDLQFACIFPLAKPVSSADCNANPDGCDCNVDELDKHSPLCTGITATTDGQQVYAKGYPGVRELQVLKGFGDNSIVASICPKNIQAAGNNPAGDPNYGYNPAVAAIVERLKEALTIKCLPRPLAPDTTGSPDKTQSNYNEDFGKVPCAVVEARPQTQSAPGVFMGCPDPTCMDPGRSALTGERAKVVDAAAQFLANEGVCGGSGANAVPCDKECYCELDQFTGDDLTKCETEPADQNDLFGYCYVDPAAAQTAAIDPTSDQGVTVTSGEQSLITGETTLVSGCNPTQRRLLRFLGTGVPAKDGLAFIACIGANAAE